MSWLLPPTIIFFLQLCCRPGLALPPARASSGTAPGARGCSCSRRSGGSPVGEELPGEDLPLVQSVEELEEALEDVGPVDGHHVELAVEAPEERLDGPVVDSAQVDGGPLGHLGAAVVHGSD